MKAVIQRTKEANVQVNNEVVGSINYGYVVLLGVTHEDTEEDAKYLVNKIINLRVFEDQDGKMNLSLKDVEGSLLSISQFTLYGDTKKGRRPNFMQAAKPEVAKSLYEVFNQLIKDQDIPLETGIFGEMMDVQLINDGPVTLIIDSKDR
ncbi:D-tyrosyl-tRNA(Tyr) deacylase [Virgibacillus halodenitrificans]|uniref:D-aminoacyl-tRNA deacylase n=1 Tax=Virgibacillus halodenitrificans TaxID=1482 RepID=A0ABR7VQ34_VIRHA|nr:D-aminoacyl-tRNA deacylase [Virgibacillus halodenitrificans]MBD1222902.1 D-tyrosyl-tRNA(Tyr) deacylase [Virgibacillus halodenitrificans]MCG1029950.1 D-tyrosyl-tRNA(Tyr) deacylase [Virgibacillus halodenitrificans]MCJ0930760.1 D-aminoacyl-tRNA deacylase [Virgibacillus halodenitrificans]MEC2159992.1 D-aminoacyl-tRNA deacylase [Virgibacillus halodenitrificans]MYL47601.1 D-tyrosyl-tRNA(Tyr) deacylase [Virgibacillus halodenitrificans]